MSAGVYSITSRASGNTYVGSAKDIEKRWAPLSSGATRSTAKNWHPPTGRGAGRTKPLAGCGP